MKTVTLYTKQMTPGTDKEIVEGWRGEAGSPAASVPASLCSQTDVTSLGPGFSHLPIGEDNGLDHTGPS